jgi:hypothetical protein
MPDNVVAALAIICIFGLPIAAWIVFRAFRFLERMEMIKHGIVPPPDAQFGFGRARAYRMWAEQQATRGAAPWQQQTQTVPPPQPGAWGCGPDDDAQRALYKGIRLAMIGFALLIGLSFIGGTPGSSSFHGGPWLLGGLIPMFVGIAQIIIAVLSGAQLPGVQSAGMYGPPPPGVPPNPPPSAGFHAQPPPSGAWQQPGRPHFEELTKPVKPPDVR